MDKRGMDSAGVWRDISDVVVKTLISIQTTLAQSYRSCKVDSSAHSPFTCFEVLGFDIMITNNLKACLVEVNHMPSFRTDSALDSRIKIGLIENTLRLLNVSADDKRKFQSRSAILSQIRLYGSSFSGKGKKAPKVETPAEMWTKYGKNEEKNLGNFELIFPADVYLKQVTSGKQAVYQGLLLKAHQSLGSPILSPDNAHLVIEEYYKSGDDEYQAALNCTTSGEELNLGSSVEKEDNKQSDSTHQPATALSTHPGDQVSIKDPIVRDEEEVKNLAERVKAALSAVVQSASNLSPPQSPRKKQKRKVKGKTSTKKQSKSINEQSKNGPHVVDGLSDACATQESTVDVSCLSFKDTADGDEVQQLLVKEASESNEVVTGSIPESNVVDQIIGVVEQCLQDFAEKDLPAQVSTLPAKNQVEFIDNQSDSVFFDEDAPPIPSIPEYYDTKVALPRVDLALQTEAALQMERLRDQYNFLKNQWLSKYQGRRQARAEQN